VAFSERSEMKEKSALPSERPSLANGKKLVHQRIKIDTFFAITSPAPRPLRTLFFMTNTGNQPVREWLRELASSDKKAIGADILAVQWKRPMGKPLVDSLGGG
jgi:hypothetical protein